MSEMIGDTAEDLQGTADLNCVAYGLHLYLATKHNDIFSESESRKKDYAVASYDERQANEILSCFRELIKKNGEHPKEPVRLQMPTPKISFFHNRDEAMGRLLETPFAAIAWRLSPAMEAMF